MFTPLNQKINSFTGSILKMGLFVSIFLTGLAGKVYAMSPPPGGADGQSQGPAAMLTSFMPLILIFVIFYFLLIRPQSKKAKEHKQMLQEIKKGDKVMTTGGIYGHVDDIDGDTVTLKIGINSDMKVKMNRNHIANLRN